MDYYTKAPSSLGYQNDASGCRKASVAGIIVNVVLLMILAACGVFSGPTYRYY